ncbi:uncharacterized protein VTP21DRAFT_8222 [Calcarisporiella thermophila]|uniref:uncharacterized protein n=1 Tax=Calcarisporiella thermophila TaxID=911321 RepID=UPI003741F104
MSMHLKILFIITSHASLPSGKNTGYYLPELAHPYHVLSKHYTIEFASPQGGRCPVDPGSVKDFANDEVCKKFMDNGQIQMELEQTEKLENIVNRAHEYAGVFFPGGHGPMFDLADNEHSHFIVRTVYEKGGIISAVCHGPAGIVRCKLSNGEYLIKDKRITCFSNEEENLVELSSQMPFLLESKIKENGGRYEKASKPWGECVVVDGRLVTGQNPASSLKLGEELHHVIQANLKEA